MIIVSNIQGTITAAVSQNPDGFLDRVLDWMNHVVDAFCGPALSDTIHYHPRKSGGGVPVLEPRLLRRRDRQ